MVPSDCNGAEKFLSLSNVVAVIMLLHVGDDAGANEATVLPVV